MIRVEMLALKALPAASFALWIACQPIWFPNHPWLTRPFWGKSLWFLFVGLVIFAFAYWRVLIERPYHEVHDYERLEPVLDRPFGDLQWNSAMFMADQVKMLALVAAYFWAFSHLNQNDTRFVALLLSLPFSGYWAIQHLLPKDYEIRPDGFIYLRNAKMLDGRLVAAVLKPVSDVRVHLVLHSGRTIQCYRHPNPGGHQFRKATQESETLADQIALALSVPSFVNWEEYEIRRQGKSLLIGGISHHGLTSIILGYSGASVSIFFLSMLHYIAMERLQKDGIVP